MTSNYYIEQNIDKKTAIHEYTASFKYLPKSITLFGSLNHICWFILDEVEQPSENIENEMYVINRQIENNTYFRYFKLEAKMESNFDDQYGELNYDKSDFVDNLPRNIQTTGVLITSEQSDQPHSQPIGIIETLIHNNFHTFITVHHPDYVEKSNQSYSVFSNYVQPKPDINNLDPRPKGKYEFIFHSFKLQINSIFFKKQKSIPDGFLIDYLNSNGEWKKLYYTKEIEGTHTITSIIHGIRFDTNILSLNDFDFFGFIHITASPQILPSSYSAFPFWGQNLNGILDSLKKISETSATESGLFEAVGQFDTSDYSQKSFLRGMHSIFEEYDDETSSITFRFGFKIKLSNYLIRVPERLRAQRGRNPHKWKLEGSNDGQDWICLDNVEDNIFDTDTEAVSYRTKDTPDYFTTFKLTKFDDIVIDSSTRFNQLILFEVEFFGIISPFYSEPSFFWEPIVNEIQEPPYNKFQNGTQVYPVVPIDLCNGILGSLNYFGGSENQKTNHFYFDFFDVNLVSLAVIHPPENLTITVINRDNEKSVIPFKNPISINNDIMFKKLQKIYYEIKEISLSCDENKIDGIEFFGFVSCCFSIINIISPSKSLSFPFSFDFKSDILQMLFQSEFPNNEKDLNEITTTFFEIKATNSMKINNIPYQLVESENGESFVIYDFVDSCVSLSFFAISCDRLELLTLEGSNDGVNFEKIIVFGKVHRNHGSKTFLIKSENKNYYRIFRLLKTKDKNEIEFTNFYGDIKLIKPRMRKPRLTETLENIIIQPGLDARNGILNALKNFPFIKKKTGNVYLFNFAEILIDMKMISLFKTNDSLNDDLIIEGFDEQNQKQFNIDFKVANITGEDDVFLPVTANSPVYKIKITTNDKKFDFDKVEFFGEIIISMLNPKPKKPPQIDYYLNPFNGILMSESVKYTNSAHPHNLEYKFDKNVLIFVNKVFIEYEENPVDDLFIEGSLNSKNWTKIDFIKGISSTNKVEYKINSQEGFNIFHFCSKSNIEIQQIEFFGKVEENNEYTENKENPVKLYLDKSVNVPFDRNNLFCGLFYTIQNFYGNLNIAISTRGTTGSEKDGISFFDLNSSSITSFIENSVIYVHFKFAEVKLSNYVMFFGPEILATDNFKKWKLEGSNDMKNWNLISTGETEISIIESNINNTESFIHFRFTFGCPCFLRKIEFFGDYIPSSEKEKENSVIVKNHPICLKRDILAGILHSMCKFTNVFEKQFVKTDPKDLSQIILNNKEVTIDKYALFSFVESILTLSYYTIETTMINWTVEVFTLNGKWVQIHNRKDSQSYSLFKINECPIFTKIRFINNDDKPQKLEKIDFFGTIEDRKSTKSFRYDLMNGLLSLLTSLHPDSVTNRKFSVKSSDYKYTNPLQIFDRHHVNRIFCFLPTKNGKETESPLAFVTLEFWKIAIQVSQYSIILFKNIKIENLKIEGSSSLSNDAEWETIDVLNENELKNSGAFMRTSKSSSFFHFIRISSSKEFSFENIEFFGDYKNEILDFPVNEADCLSAPPQTNFEVDAIMKFPFTQSKSKGGFFHNDEVDIDGFIQISSPSQNKEKLICFLKNQNSSEIVTLRNPNQFIIFKFLTTSFQLSHMYIECLTNNVNLEVFAGERNIFCGKLPKMSQNSNEDSISNENLIKFDIQDPENEFQIKFESTENVKIRYLEFYGNLMQNNNCPDNLMSLDHNKISLSFGEDKNNLMKTTKAFGLMNKKKRYDMFRDGVINFIYKNYSQNSQLLSIYEKHQNNPKLPKNILNGDSFILSFRNSPQVTFDFGSSTLRLEKYALDTKMRRWILEGSQNGGETWFFIDVQYKPDKNSKLFTFNKPIQPVSMIRLTNMDALIDINSNYSNEVRQIEFFGDLQVNYPKRIDDKSEKITFSSVVGLSEDQINDDDDLELYLKSKPQENLIFFSNDAFSSPKQPDGPKINSSPRSFKASQPKSDIKDDKKKYINDDDYEIEYEYEELDQEINEPSDNESSADESVNFANFSVSEILHQLANIRFANYVDDDDNDDDDDDFTDDDSW